MRFQKLQIIALVSILVFIPSLGYVQADFCPEGAYVGRDNQGNTACRDIISNQILNSETIVTDSGRGTITDSGRGTITDSGRGTITDSGRGTISDSGRTITNSDKEILNDDQTDYTIFGILGIIGVIGVVFTVYGKKILSGISGKKIVSGIPQRGWSNIQKEQVRTRQYQMCNICYTKPAKWAYDHIDGDKKNNDINNCQGLCVQCKSEKMMIRI